MVSSRLVCGFEMASLGWATPRPAAPAHPESIGRRAPLRPPTLRRRRAPCYFHKMYVPGFGEASPEAKAAKNLQDFFNYVAVQVVLSQLESYNREAYAELMEFVGRTSLNDADSFCKKLMRESPRHKNLALRILEVRSAYAKQDFEWDNLKKLAFKMVDEANTRLMREYVLETSHIQDDKRQ